MTIGPNEDGAELYREHLESQPCPTCGTRESEYRSLRARIALLEEVAESAKRWHEHDRLCTLGRFAHGKMDHCSCGLKEFHAVRRHLKEGK